MPYTKRLKGGSAEGTLGQASPSRQRGRLKKRRRAFARRLSVFLLLPRPFLAPLNAVTLVLGGRIKGKLVQLLARKTVAKAAVRFAPFLAARLDGAFGAPERFLYRQAASAFHDFAPLAFAAQQAAPGFYHGSRLLDGEARRRLRPFAYHSKKRGACQSTGAVSPMPDKRSGVE